MTTSIQGRAISKLDNQGRLLIPAEMREQLGIKPGERLTLLIQDGELVVLTFKAGIRRAQKIGLKYKVPGRSLVDELIADRRAEARVSNFVLDASTVIAILDSEPGGDEAADLLQPGCFLSTVNLAEVVARLRSGGWPDDEIDEQLEVLDIVVVEFSRPQAFDAGFLDTLASGKRLALGDRACLALARQLHLPALTGDRIWATIELGVEIRLFR